MSLIEHSHKFHVVVKEIPELLTDQEGPAKLSGRIGESQRLKRWE